MTNEEIQRLAAVYTDAIRDAVTSEEWSEIIKLNRASDDDGYDATHDFVDANHYLIEAYKEVFGEYPRLDDDYTMVELAAAVDYALEAFFK